MIFLKKNKPLLKDLVSNNFIDIHSHLLPRIDDGAESINDTIKLISELEKIGFSKFITTPHVIKDIWENSLTDINHKYNSTITELKKQNIITSLNIAAEYMLDDSFMKLFQNEKLLVLKENYVLVEMSYINPPLNLYTILFELQIAGYKPILAHPERYDFYHFSFDEYKKLRKVGCLFQLNLLSTTGYYGSQVSKTADLLLKNNMIDFVGSDVHHMNHVSFFQKKIILEQLAPLQVAIENNKLFK